jgi:hypothetical protein
VTPMPPSMPVAPGSSISGGHNSASSLPPVFLTATLAFTTMAGSGKLKRSASSSHPPRPRTITDYWATPSSVPVAGPSVAADASSSTPDPVTTVVETTSLSVAAATDLLDAHAQDLQAALNAYLEDISVADVEPQETSAMMDTQPPAQEASAETDAEPVSQGTSTKTHAEPLARGISAETHAEPLARETSATTDMEPQSTSLTMTID